MTVNVELLQKTLETIKANPDHWDQDHWHCETSHCFAGFAELISLGLPIDSDECDLRDKASIYNDIKCHWKTRDNAIKALGLEGLQHIDGDYEALFAPYNSLEDLSNMVAYLSTNGTLVEYFGDDDKDSEGWSDED